MYIHELFCMRIQTQIRADVKTASYLHTHTHLYIHTYISISISMFRIYIHPIFSIKLQHLVKQVSRDRHQESASHMSPPTSVQVPVSCLSTLPLPTPATIPATGTRVLGPRATGLGPPTAEIALPHRLSPARVGLNHMRLPCGTAQ